jgi:hypothetical protein
MTLEEYMRALRKLVKQNPKAKKFKIVYSIDDEGNGFDDVKFGPTMGITDRFNDFKANIDQDKSDTVCVN